MALLIVMGTSLMNCTNKSGYKQKIDSVEVIDYKDTKVINVLEGLPTIENKDTIPTTTSANKKELYCNNPMLPTQIKSTGLIITETSGDVSFIENPSKNLDAITLIEPPTLEGEIEIMGDVINNNDIIYSLITVGKPPEFKNTPQSLSIREKRDFFQNKIQKFVLENFEVIQGDKALSGKQRLNVLFKIDSLGFVKDIKVRSHHPLFEQEAIRVIQLLPKFLPAKHKNKPVEMVYNLPVIFPVKE